MRKKKQKNVILNQLAARLILISFKSSIFCCITEDFCGSNLNKKIKIFEMSFFFLFFIKLIIN